MNEFEIINKVLLILLVSYIIYQGSEMLSIFFSKLTKTEYSGRRYKDLLKIKDYFFGKKKDK